MNILQSIMLGIVEGLTEFLPVSSTFHLIAVSNILHLENSDFLKLFEVVIQSGAISAVLFLYAARLLRDRSLLSKVIVSFLPTALVGFLLHDTIKRVFFESTGLMLTVFGGVGVLFLLLEKSKLSLTRNCESLTLKQALLIGLAQACAIVPGVSRAGAVIVAMMFLGFKRESAATYTFYLSLPTILAAGTLDLYQGRELLTNYEGGWTLLAVGFLASLLVATVVVKWLIQYLASHTLAIFGWYRLALTLILLGTMAVV